MEKKENLEKKMRKYTIGFMNLLERIVHSIPKIDEEKIKHNTLYILFNNIFTYTEHAGYETHAFISIVIVMTFYTELFKHLLEKEMYGELKEEEAVLLNQIRKIDSFEQAIKLFNTPEILNRIIEIIKTFDEQSAFQKVLLMKCMQEKDKEKILKFNPCFEEEYKELNIEITKEFLKRQIHNWQVQLGDDIEQACAIASDFLNELITRKTDTLEYIYFVNDLLAEYYPEDIENTEDSLLVQMRKSLRILYQMEKTDRK